MKKVNLGMVHTLEVRGQAFYHKGSDEFAFYAQPVRIKEDDHGRRYNDFLNADEVFRVKADAIFDKTMSERHVAKLEELIANKQW